jgi:hypothetical protein
MDRPIFQKGAETRAEAEIRQQQAKPQRAAGGTRPVNCRDDVLSNVCGLGGGTAADVALPTHCLHGGG